MTDAAVHDSQVVDDIFDPDNTASGVCADCAFGDREPTMTKFTRREFLAATAGAALAPAAASSVGHAEEAPIVLRAESRTIEVNGKAAKMLHWGA